MSKRAVRLKFTEEELADSVVKKAAKQAAKQVDKLEKDESKLSFAESKKSTSKLTHAARDAPVHAVSSGVHRAVNESEQDNVGVESVHKLEETAEHSVHTARSVQRSRSLRPYRKANRAENKADRANLKALNRQAEQSGVSKGHRYQKRAIKKEYAAAKRAADSAASSVSASSITKKAADSAAGAGSWTARFFAQHKKGFALLAVAALMLMLLLNSLSSCSALLEGGLSAIGMSTYPSADVDMLSAEAQYTAMEAALQATLDNYEATHDYDEYQFDLDEIEHDPYVLISILTALRGGAWTIGEVQDTLQMLFEKQYILTENVTVETRYWEETETWTDDDGVEHTETTSVPYEYTICTVSLENFNLSHVPIYIMSQDQLSLYAMYMGTLGNRPDLFPGSDYVGRYTGSYTDYEIPPEALTDERFEAMMAEATKYLGYPYVWGGSSPATSFDCSGYVSWVINHSGWNVGRLGATGLYYICTPVSPANAKPGDLIFFQGTYATDGMSHVGIYVGNGMMIHCGDPIQYANINTSYWQAHFAAFGRLP